MPKERRETAIECIEWTFGKVESYEESYGECQEVHLFEVTLNSGDVLCFEDGALGDYTIVSPRLRENVKDPSRYDYWWEGMEVYGHFILDENGRIKEIGCWFNAC